MMNLMRTLVTLTIVVTSQIAIPSIGEALDWTPEAMMKMKTISDVQLSPDNQTALFVATEAKIGQETGSYLSRIYKSTLNDNNCKPFTSDDYSSSQPRWSPNGKWIAFLSARNGVKNLYLINADGGEAVALMKSKRDVQNFCWSPDGKQIAFVMADEIEEMKNHKRTSLAYEFDQETIINRLWVIDVFSPDAVPKALTDDDYCVRGAGDFGIIDCEYDWSPDSKSITFARSPSLDFDAFYVDSSLATVDLKTYTVIDWEKQSHFEGMPRYSPDGKWVAYLYNNNRKKHSDNYQVALHSTEGDQTVILSSTYNEGSFFGSSSILGWSQDGAYVIFLEPKSTKFHIMLLPVDGSPAQELASNGYFFRDAILSRDRIKIGCIVQSPALPPEACVADLSDFQPMPISALNESFKQLPEAATELISWKSIDGIEIEGLLTYPTNYEEGKQYPLLLVIHGGPAGFFNESFLGTPNAYPFATFADAGYLILRPNPRGSCGYGHAFRCACYSDWGGNDYEDLMAGVDTLIEQGLADPERMGVMGWSYGGFMTGRVVTQTSRFKAASAGAGIYNMVSMTGTTDMPRSFLPDYFEGHFNENLDLYLDRSPLLHVEEVTTPILIQHGTDDRRVPISQAYEFYYALDHAGKLPVLMVYPGMGHRFSDPNMQLDAMKHNLEWFNKYLN